jgi:DDE superfamily endonuclease
MEKVENKTEQFCHDILGLPVNRHRPLANLVMSLSSYPEAKSVVELSESEFFHYHYSNLPKILNDIAPDAAGEIALNTHIRSLIIPYLPPIREELGVSFYGLSTDVTKLLKAYSPTLEGRGYVPIANNVIASNQAIGVGYRVSMTHLNALEQGAEGWCPPLEVKRLSVQDNAIEVAVEQIQSLLTDKTLPFESCLCIEKADMGYAHASFLSPLYDLENLVCLVRLRPSSKVWQMAQVFEKSTESDVRQGAPAIYGKKWYLTDKTQDKMYTRKGESYTVWQDSIMDLPPSDSLEVSGTLKNGRKVILFLSRWNDLLKRTKDGYSMKDKPLDMVRVLVQDAQSGEKVFDRPLFIAVSGKRKKEIPTPLVQTQYRERSDVEGVYRFGKHSMLLDKLQTPDVKHLDNWLKVWGLSVWLLFTARQQTPLMVKVWEKYLPINKTKAEQVNPVLTMPQVRKGISLLFATFDKTLFLPGKYKKGIGRQKGQTQPKRNRFPVTKKLKKFEKIKVIKLKCQKNE